MPELVFTNYRLVLESEVLTGTLIVRDGVIVEIQPGVVRTGEEGEGDFLLPGFVELHTDNWEHCLSPRPGVHWNLPSALQWHERDLIGAGITTACTAIALRDVPGQPIDAEQIAAQIAAISEGTQSGFLQLDHRFNLRCELASLRAGAVLETHLTHPRLAVISMMDHTPGQRQFQTVEDFRTYYRSRYRLSENELDQYQNQLQSVDSTAVQQHRLQIAEMARSHRVCLSTHDDATPEHITEAVADGAKVAEFPTTLRAAQEAHRHGLQVLMGAPNVVRNRSHSGNLSARQASTEGVLDILSSDYAPPSLLEAAFLLHREEGLPLPDAVRRVSLAPAEAIGLGADRGSLQVGKRADFIVVRPFANLPRLQSVWITGTRIG
jgi:alpha-D-ribose 1-methylphosphonate 5-triphosphate diphosphatase